MDLMCLACEKDTFKETPVTTFECMWCGIENEGEVN
jgi:hypothetical protein